MEIRNPGYSRFPCFYMFYFHSTEIGHSGGKHKFCVHKKRSDNVGEIRQNIDNWPLLKMNIWHLHNMNIWHLLIMNTWHLLNTASIQQSTSQINSNRSIVQIVQIVQIRSCLHISHQLLVEWSDRVCFWWFLRVSFFLFVFPFFESHFLMAQIVAWAWLCVKRAAIVRWKYKQFLHYFALTTDFFQIKAR